jgi:eukaryotic-like serine/threonine-protein kinase
MTEGLDAADAGGAVYSLGRYLVLAGLGEGGMARVYLALARGPNAFNKLVVLKVLHSPLAEDDTFLTMFLAEACLAARLNHANIVQTYEIGVHGGRHCIVMEYLEGRSIAGIEAATKHAPTPLSVGVRVLADTLGALHYAHELADVDGRPLRLVHRDVSPHNVFVTYDGQVKLLDFGIAKAADDGARTTTGVFKGKLRYTAPERFTGEESDRRSDIFSVGVMLWQLLTRRRLWSGLNEFAVIQQLTTRTPVSSARTVNPDVPARLDEICSKALAMFPRDRFQTAAEMQDALEEVLATESFGTTNRALGKYMKEVFGEAQAKFRRKVDEQIRVASAISLDFESSRASFAGLRSDAIPQLGAMFGSGSVSSVPAAPPSFSEAGAGRRVASSRPPGLAVSVVPADLPRPPRRRGAALALVALVLAASVFLVSLRGAENGEPPPPAARSAATAGPPAAPSEPPAPAPVPASHLEPTPTIPALSARQVSRVAPASSGALRGTPPLPHAAAPPAETKAPALPVPQAAPPKVPVDCSSPYFLDEDGLKRVRPECL